MVTAARAFGHEPVLYSETLAELVKGSGGMYIDATLGSAGHAEAILAKTSPDGRLLGIDADPDALVVARERLSSYGDRVVLAQSNYAHISAVARKHGFAGCQGILFDLGLSSRQLSSEGRGFSFQDDTILDMRLDPAQKETAADLVNMMQEQDLADLIYQLGDEPASRRIARAIVAQPPDSHHRPTGSADREERRQAWQAASGDEDLHGAAASGQQRR